MTILGDMRAIKIQKQQAEHFRSYAFLLLFTIKKLLLYFLIYGWLVVGTARSQEILRSPNQGPSCSYLAHTTHTLHTRHSQGILIGTSKNFLTSSCTNYQPTIDQKIK